VHRGNAIAVMLVHARQPYQRGAACFECFQRYPSIVPAAPEWRR
jgi:hypothetical protein